MDIDQKYKLAHILTGEAYERRFIEVARRYYGLDAKFNPEKKDSNYVVDLLIGGKLADLKYQKKPFFKANEWYGLDPRHTVCVDVCDFEKYMERHPEMDIYWWVDWKVNEWTDYSGKPYWVEPLKGIYRATLKRVAELVKTTAVRHTKSKRKYNNYSKSKEAYLLDLRDLEKLEPIQGQLPLFYLPKSEVIQWGLETF